ncbi:hypothetical protein N0V88_002573 [Collariella sp. IMI 366227]|nr:hypothetical protein N0V88_002573 [Collariella sp. IMI 366227]
MAVGTLSLIFPVFLPMGAAAVAYAGHRATFVDWRAVITHFLMGPGRTSRILLVLFLVLNWKSLPLAWTVRVFHAFVYHTDYNFHKSNSTYFADLDVSRSHLVTHLLGPGIPIISDNEKNKLVRDKDGNLIKGSFGMGLGAVFCSFRKEIGPLQGYEMWSRILSWDRKWLYIVTHFVVKGKVKPTSWDGKRMGPTRNKVLKADGSGEVVDFSKYVIATAISKYVFKLGRFTVNPAIVIEACELLPERPGEGWTGGETGTGTPEDLGDIDERGEWDWTTVELERRKGLEYAEHFAALDGTNGLFDGGEDGAIGKFPLG